MGSDSPSTTSKPQARLIAVDIGNSATKIGWFDEPCGAATRLELPAAVHTFPTGQAPPPNLVAELPEEPCTWWIASVNREGTRVLSKWIESHRPQESVKLLERDALPIAVQVDVPERVGLDRLAAAVAANALREPGRAAIVVGAGSAITVNLVNPAGAFVGGAILPGFRMSSEALFGADLLPLALLEPDGEEPPVLGTHTEAAIRSGLFWGAVGAVREIVSRMSAPFDPPPQVFVTGGDLRPLTSQLGGGAQYYPNLVLAGIGIAARGK